MIIVHKKAKKYLISAFLQQNTANLMCGIEDMLPMMHEMQHFNQIAKRIANIRLTIILYQPRSFVRYSFGVHPIDSRKIFPI